MILYTLIAILVAKIKGYKIKPVFKAYALYPYAVLEIVFWVMQANIFMHNYNLLQYASYIKSAFILVMIVPMLVYKLYKQGIIGSALVLAGTFLNKFVIAQNGGKMPVYATLSKLTGYYNEAAIQTAGSMHVVGNAGTKFKFLTDYIDIGWSVLSIGDLLIHAFTFIMIFYTIKKINEREIKNGGKLSGYSKNNPV